ncbi:hypothetical protein MNBD_IGNAVI01-2854 [hydrothermal vent metagenome]|uniref:Uncharacterized protein n=1 Tax=hydrothermal vent metagenome TaxID=652676 RepID=A0A3B1CGP9_9ZZZZ
MKNKIILITGATDGIGKQTAIELAKFGAKIIVHGRNNEKCIKTVAEITDKTGNSDIDHLSADLTSLAQVKEMADKVKSKYERLDVLINNAGVFENEKTFTFDGYEITFAVNHLAHFLLTILLLDLIKKSAPSRIINVSSMAHSGNEFDLENLNSEKSFSSYNAYSISKAANILFTYKLAEDLKDAGVTVNALHPGVISTKLLHKGWAIGGDNLESGAATSVYLASSEEVEGVTRKYFSNKRQSHSSSLTHDKELQEKLWDISYKMVEKFL